MRAILGMALLAVFAFAAAIKGDAQAAPPFHFHFGEQPGPFLVGLRVVEQYDRTRSFEDGSRPIQTLLWYPAKHTGTVPMTLGEYADFIKTETSFGKPVEHGPHQDHVAEFTHGVAGMPTRAVRNAAVEAGRFPLVIYAPSLNGANTENIELCEYLASYGFVVMASPSLGADGRAMTVDAAGADAQAGDISFLIGFAKSLPDVDLSEVAAIGYSWGGTAELLAAARDPRIDALVVLDGSFLYGSVPAGDVHPEKMEIPLLVFTRGEEPLAVRDRQVLSAPPPGILSEWTRGDLLHLELLAASHLTFSSMYQGSERFRNEALQFAPADYTLEEGAESYNWMARYTREFLDAYLKHDRAAMAFLRRTPAENGVPKHLIAEDVRMAATKGADSAQKARR